MKITLEQCFSAINTSVPDHDKISLAADPDHYVSIYMDDEVANQIYKKLADLFAKGAA